MDILSNRSVLRSLLLLIVLYFSASGATTAHAALDLGLDSDLPEVASMVASDSDLPVVITDSSTDFDLQMVEGSSVSGSAFGVVQPGAVARNEHDGCWLVCKRERLSKLLIQQAIEVVPIEGMLRMFA